MVPVRLRLRQRTIRTTFEIAKRHDLPIESIISPEGKMINVPAQFLGLTPVEARARVFGSTGGTGVTPR